MARRTSLQVGLRESIRGNSRDGGITQLNQHQDRQRAICLRMVAYKQGADLAPGERMKAELNIGILAETLTLLYGEASAANVSRTYTTIARLQAEADAQGYTRGYAQGVYDAPDIEPPSDPATVNAFQARLEKAPNVVTLCGTRLVDDEIELFQRDSGDETDYD